MRFRFAGFSVEVKPGTITANRVLTLPDIGGVLAVTSQLKRTSLLVTATRNLAATDALLHLYSTSASNFTLTILNSTFAVDDEVEIACDSTGTLTLACGSGVTINGAGTSVVCAAGKGGYLKFRSASSARWYGGS